MAQRSIEVKGAPYLDEKTMQNGHCFDRLHTPFDGCGPSQVSDEIVMGC